MALTTIQDSLNPLYKAEVTSARELKVTGNMTATVTGGSFSTSGLSTGMRTTAFMVTDVPQAVPSTAFVNRNTMSVRVWGANTVFFGSSTMDYTNGYPKNQFEEISMDIKDNAAVELYAVCAPGLTCEIRIIEVA